MLPWPSRPARGLSRVEVDAAEVAAVDVRHAVVSSEPLVQEGVARGQEVGDAAAMAQHVADEELGLALERTAQRHVVIGEQEDVGVLGLDVAKIEPLRGEVRDHRLGARVGEHSVHLRAQHAGLVEPPVERRLEQLVVRDAAPKEEREPRRELDVADGHDADRRVVARRARRRPAAVRARVRTARRAQRRRAGRARRCAGARRRLALDPIQELRAHEQTLERELDARVEAAVCAALLVEWHQILEVGVGNRAPIRAPRELSQDLARARRLLGRVRRTANEDSLAARRVAGPGRRVRSANRRDRDGGQRAAAAHARAQQALVERLRALDESDADEMRPGRDRHLEQRVIAAAPRNDHGADRLRAGAHAVDADLDLVLVARRARGFDLERIRRVERKVALDRESAARAERQLIDALVLRQLLRKLVDVHEHRRPHVADREPRELLRGADVALHHDRRDEQQVGDVVEAAARVVGGQQQLVVELGGQMIEREEIADRVLVFGAREAAE